MAYSLFHTVKYKNHSVGYIFHTVGYKSRSVKQRIDKGILGNIEGVFYFHIMRHAVSVFFCMVVIYENRYDEHKKIYSDENDFCIAWVAGSICSGEGTDIDLAPRPTETSRCSFIYQTKANQSIR